MNRKEEITEGLGQARQRILEIAAGLPLGIQNDVFLGSWHIKDLLAHLIGWDYTNISAVTDILTGMAPRVFEHWDPDWASYNAVLVEKHGEEDMTKLLQVIQRSHQELIEFVSQIPAEDIGKDFGIRSPDGTNINPEWWLQYEIDDEGRHLQQIKDWLQGRNEPKSETN